MPQDICEHFLYHLHHAYGGATLGWQAILYLRGCGVYGDVITLLFTLAHLGYQFPH